ncbi:MAG: hypothetical protein AB1324_03480 [Candidatus Micrarchaeota archaeon]
MTGPGLAQPEPMETRPPRVSVPRLSREETQRRAERAFDASMQAVLRSHFRPPPAAEVTAFRNMVNARLRQTREGETLDIGAVLEDYCRANPSSAIARYNRLFGGDTSWLMSGDRIAFNSAAFNTLARNYVSAARQPTVNALVQLNDPRNRTVPVPITSLESDIVAALQTSLSGQLRSGSNQLPATVAFERQEERLMFASLLPPPDQNVDFSRKG